MYFSICRVVFDLAPSELRKLQRDMSIFFFASEVDVTWE